MATLIQGGGLFDLQELKLYDIGGVMSIEELLLMSSLPHSLWTPYGPKCLSSVGCPYFSSVL